MFHVIAEDTVDSKSNLALRDSSLSLTYTYGARMYNGHRCNLSSTRLSLTR